MNPITPIFRRGMAIRTAFVNVFVNPIGNVPGYPWATRKRADRMGRGRVKSYRINIYPKEAQS